MKTGLFPGSFNPVHNGHIRVANYMLDETDLEEVWFIVTPQNPFKQELELADTYHRLAMVRKSLLQKNIPKAITAEHADFEMLLPTPSYTFNTLIQLRKLYSEKIFSLIIGSDNLHSFHRWKYHESIIAEHRLYIYPRPGYDCLEYPAHPNICITNAPLIDVSSEMVREKIIRGDDVSAFLPAGVIRYISEHHLFV